MSTTPYDTAPNWAEMPSAWHSLQFDAPRVAMLLRDAVPPATAVAIAEAVNEALAKRRNVNV